MKFAPLVENEVLKLLKRRRFRVALLILIALNGLIVFATVQSRDRRPRRDWRIEAQERVARMQNWERSRRLPPTQLRWVKYEIARVQYHLDRNVDPEAISGPLFARGFSSASSYLLFPLLAILFAADIVSSEFAQGTIKLLLTRPVGRARVLSSKFAALVVAITLTITLGGVVAYLFGGLAFGYRGWGAPVLAGFRLIGDVFDPESVRSLPLWKDTLLSFGLAWYSALAVGAIAFLTSVVLRSTAAAMGTMLAALIAGTILPRVAPTWEAQRYLFVTNLPLPDYYSGSPAPITGMTVPFSVAVLAVWAVAAALVAYAVFLRRDVLA
jgi:ABC-2 type transport system permease protein